MKKTLSHSTKILTAVALIATSAFASADRKRHIDYARVTDAKPIYQTFARKIPVEHCRIETVAVDRRDRRKSSLIGGLIGGAVGHKIAHRHDTNHLGSTVAGVLIGASIAERSHDRNRDYREVERCTTRYKTERYSEVVGYDVTYRYRGKYFHTQTDNHPGKRIPVNVSVRPAF